MDSCGAIANIFMTGFVDQRKRSGKPDKSDGMQKLVVSVAES